MMLTHSVGQFREVMVGRSVPAPQYLGPYLEDKHKRGAATMGPLTHGQPGLCMWAFTWWLCWGQSYMATPGSHHVERDQKHFSRGRQLQGALLFPGNEQGPTWGWGLKRVPAARVGRAPRMRQEHVANFGK